MSPSTEKLDLVVVIPIGPTCAMDYVQDTVDSVVAYTSARRRIILADDSHKGTAQAVAVHIPEVDIVVTPRPRGVGGGLYLSLCDAYAYALNHYRFDALLRLDTDALVTGPFPEKIPIQMFTDNPRLAVGGEIYVDNCSVRARYEAAADPKQARARLMSLLQRPFSQYRWRHYLAERTLGSIYKRALASGYTSVDYVFGGCYVMSERFLQALQAQKFLPHPHLGQLGLEEDHLFGLLAGMLEMELADMQTGVGPFGTAWKSLPASPADLIAQGKKVVHSTRRWQDMDENAIRAIFRTRRQEYAG